MVALQLVIEKITGKSMWAYAEQEIYLPLGMNSTVFLPQPWNKCAPTLKGYPGWRDSIIRCHVHDPTAYILGGVSGNAGVFANHGDLIKFMTMML
jgi:CubicO group peptidase (beta-lactamase class C family)